MKKIFDHETVEKAICECRQEKMLRSLQAPLLVIEYEDGESIESVLDDNKYFQIILSGDLSIVLIRDDGSTYNIATGGEGYVLGDMALFTDAPRDICDIFTQASGTVRAIACDEVTYKEELVNNILFMQFLAGILVEKMKTFVGRTAVYPSLSDQVISYMQYKCSEHTLSGVEKTAFALHCSTRQLQRTLNKLSDEGVISKIGKGSYILT